MTNPSNQDRSAQEELVSAFVDGELDPASRLQVEAMLAADPGLRELERSLRELSASLRSLPPRRLHRDLVDDVLRSIATDSPLEEAEPAEVDEFRSVGGSGSMGPALATAPMPVHGAGSPVHRVSDRRHWTWALGALSALAASLVGVLLWLPSWLGPQNNLARTDEAAGTRAMATDRPETEKGIAGSPLPGSEVQSAAAPGSSAMLAEQENAADLGFQPGGDSIGARPGSSGPVNQPAPAGGELVTGNTDGVRSLQLQMDAADAVARREEMPGKIQAVPSGPAVPRAASKSAAPATESVGKSLAGKDPSTGSSAGGLGAEKPGEPDVAGAVPAESEARREEAGEAMDRAAGMMAESDPGRPAPAARPDADEMAADHPDNPPGNLNGSGIAEPDLPKELTIVPEAIVRGGPALPAPEVVVVTVSRKDWAGVAGLLQAGGEAARRPPGADETDLIAVAGTEADWGLLQAGIRELAATADFQTVTYGAPPAVEQKLTVPLTKETARFSADDRTADQSSEGGQSEALSASASPGIAVRFLSRVPHNANRPAEVLAWAASRSDIADQLYLLSDSSDFFFDRQLSENLVRGFESKPDSATTKDVPSKDAENQEQPGGRQMAGASQLAQADPGSRGGAAGFGSAQMESGGGGGRAAGASRDRGGLRGSELPDEKTERRDPSPMNDEQGKLGDVLREQEQSGALSGGGGNPAPEPGVAPAQPMPAAAEPGKRDPGSPPASGAGVVPPSADLRRERWHAPAIPVVRRLILLKVVD